MKFLHPSVFYYLGLIPIFYGLMALRFRAQKARLDRFLRESLWRSLIPELSSRRAWVKFHFLMVAFVFSIMAIARPQLGLREETAKVTGMDILFVLDVSNSMEVEDVVPSRMRKAHHVIRSIVERLRGDRVGLVAFAGSSYLAAPLTTDLEYIMEILPTLTPASITNQGTDFGIALQTAQHALQNGAEEQATGAGSKVIILVSDGEDLEESFLEAADNLKKNDIHFFALGLGTEKGGPIPIRDEGGTLRGYKRDAKGESVISRFTSGALEKLAKRAGGQVWTVTEAEGEVGDVIEALRSFSRGDLGEKKIRIYDEKFQYPLALALLFLLLQWGIGVRAKPERKVATALLWLIGFSVFTASLPARADSVKSYLENERGLDALKKGDAEEAKKRFESAKESTDSPIIDFNRALTESSQQNWEEAERLQESSIADAQKRGDPATAARGFYNLGSGFEKQNRREEAINAWLEAISNAKRAELRDVEDAARKKIERLVQEQQKQDQKNEKKDDKKDQQKKQEQDQKDQNKKEQENPEKKDSDEQKPAQVQEPKNQRYQSAKLSKEDAERVLSELSQKEKDLQSKLKKQQNKGKGRQRDW